MIDQRLAESVIRDETILPKQRVEALYDEYFQAVTLSSEICSLVSRELLSKVVGTDTDTWTELQIIFINGINDGCSTKDPLILQSSENYFRLACQLVVLLDPISKGDARDLHSELSTHWSRLAQNAIKLLDPHTAQVFLSKTETMLRLAGRALNVG